MEVLEIFESLEKVGSSSAKLDILKKHKDNAQFHQLMDAALNYKRKFFIKKWGNIPSIDNHDCLHDQFLELLNNLEATNSRSDADVLAVEKFMAECNELQQKWYSRVLVKNLRIGVGVSMAVKAGYDIPLFEVQLAKDAKKSKKFQQIVEKGVFLSPKLDGYRCVAIVEDGICTLFTREGNIFENFPDIVKEVEDFARANKKTHMVLDGEIMSDDFNATQQSAFASTRGTVVGDMKYHVFDEIPYDEWITDNFTLNAVFRYIKLKNHFTNYKGNALVYVEHVPCNTVAQAYQYERDCILEGYEGAMVNPNIPYYRGKPSNKMMKLKTFLSMDCIVHQIYEGEGKYKSMMGGITVIQENNKKCDVGTGFSDKDRYDIWGNPDLIVGRLVEVKYQEIGSDGRMRFPVFMRYRDQGKSTGKC